MISLIDIIHERAERLQKNLYHLSENGESISVFEKNTILADVELIKLSGLDFESRQISELLKLVSVRNSIDSEVLYAD